jgi:hypothetical protein
MVAGFLWLALTVIAHRGVIPAPLAEPTPLARLAICWCDLGLPSVHPPALSWVNYIDAIISGPSMSV